MGLGLEWLADERNSRDVRALCRRCCRGRHDLVEDLFCECASRVDNIIATWDEDMGAGLRGHMKKSLAWYCFKWMNKHEKQSKKERTREKLHAGSYKTADPAILDAVQYIAERLHEFDSLMLRLRIIESLTFLEIGERIGVSKNTAREYYTQAIARARELLE